MVAEVLGNILIVKLPGLEKKVGNQVVEAPSVKCEHNKSIAGRICCRAQPCSFNCHSYNYSDFAVWAIGSFASAIISMCLCVVLTIK